jgi:DNA-directed RNA polymerase specialized sigma subunit
MLDAKRELALAHLPLVRAIAAKAKRDLPHEVELDELVAYGCRGLMEAAERAGRAPAPLGVG